jgi:hypothetical protein
MIRDMGQADPEGAVRIDSDTIDLTRSLLGNLMECDDTLGKGFARKGYLTLQKGYDLLLTQNGRREGEEE